LETRRSAVRRIRRDVRCTVVCLSLTSRILTSFRIMMRLLVRHGWKCVGLLVCSWWLPLSVPRRGF
jgi:hypothetical protein